VITVTAHGRASVLQIDRPERRNALDTDTCNQLRQGLQDSVQGGALAVVITGQGSSFCSGADLSGVYGDEFLLALRTMLSAITDAPVPVIAAVNGPAIGAGTQLAVACDLRVAAPTAVFGVPTSQLGLAAEAFTLRRLALFAGGGAARRMMLAAHRRRPGGRHWLGAAHRHAGPDERGVLQAGAQHCGRRRRRLGRGRVPAVLDQCGLCGGAAGAQGEAAADLPGSLMLG